MNICKDKRDCAKLSAGKTAEIIVKAIRRKGFSNIVVSAGISQYQMLYELSKANIEWWKVNVFQLDDYVGIPRNHPASFGKFLRDSFDKNIESLKRFTKQIMKSKAIVCTVTGKHKAKAVKNVVEGKVTDTVPASILKRHRDCWLFLDDAAAGQIKSSVASR